jgi:hypothetical protein
VADVTVSCPKCGKSATVSEFAGSEALVCDSCGTALPMPPVSRPEIRLRDLPPAPPPSTAVPDHPIPEANTMPVTQRMRRWYRIREQKAAAHHYWIAWLFFVVMGLCLWLLRYRDLLSDPERDAMVHGALVLLGLLHLFVIGTAFRDDFFHGVLCLLVPFYSIYYLFAISDAFFVRALAGALLVAFGMDAFHFSQNTLYNVYVTVTAWIQQTDLPSSR